MPTLEFTKEDEAFYQKQLKLKRDYMRDYQNRPIPKAKLKQRRSKKKTNNQ